MNLKKILSFLGITFIISWSIWGLLVYSGLQYDSVLSQVIIAFGVMTSPALAAFLVQKVFYIESLSTFGLRIKGMNFKALLASVLIGCGIIIIALGIIAFLGNAANIAGFGTIDLSQSFLIDQLNDQLDSQGSSLEITKTMIPFSGWVMLIIIVVVSVIAAFSFNLPFMFGEEYGWRGFLVNETRSMGFVLSNTLIGLIWGIWHAPGILQGLNYPEHPWVGMVLMIAFTIPLSLVLTWSRLKTRSILAPCVIHGIINGAAGVMIFVQNSNSLLGSIVGVAGILAVDFFAMGIFIFDTKFIENYQRYFNSEKLDKS